MGKIVNKRINPCELCIVRTTCKIACDDYIEDLKVPSAINYAINRVYKNPSEADYKSVANMLRRALVMGENLFNE